MKSELYWRSKYYKKNRDMQRACLYSSCATKAPAINSHQISRKQLDNLAVDGELVTCKPIEGKLIADKKYYLFRRPSPKKALAFKGYCSVCDNSVFKNADDTSTAFSSVKAIEQSARSVSYLLNEERITYRAVIDARKKIGLVGDELGSWRPAILGLKNETVVDEWKYLKKSYFAYISLYFDANANANGSSNVWLATREVEDINLKIGFAFSSTIYLTADFWGKPVSVPWKGKDTLPPLATFMLLKYQGKWHLALTSHSIYSKQAIQFWNQVLSVPEDELLFQLFRFSTYANMGTVISPNFLSMFEKQCPRELKLIESHGEWQSNIAKPFNWQILQPVPKLGTLRLV